MTHEWHRRPQAAHVQSDQGCVPVLPGPRAALRGGDRGPAGSGRRGSGAGSPLAGVPPRDSAVRARHGRRGGSHGRRGGREVRLHVGADGEGARGACRWLWVGQRRVCQAASVTVCVPEVRAAITAWPVAPRHAQDVQADIIRGRQRVRLGSRGSADVDWDGLYRKAEELKRQQAIEVMQRPERPRRDAGTFSRGLGARARGSQYTTSPGRA